jgi:hypothetical protein
VRRGGIAQRQLEEAERPENEVERRGGQGLLSQAKAVVGAATGLVHAPEVGVDERAAAEREGAGNRRHVEQAELDRLLRDRVGGRPVAGPQLELALEDQQRERELAVALGALHNRRSLVCKISVC